MNCNDCGVCCLHMAVPPYDDDERELLRKNLPKLYAELLAVEATRTLQLKVTGTDYVACAFFDLATRKCRHHYHKPEVCVRFQIEGEFCLQQRRNAGLPDAGN